MTGLMQDAARPQIVRSGFPMRQLAAVWKFWSDFVARNTLRAQFIDLDRRGALDAFLTDVGLCRADLDKLVRNYPESGRLLPAMLAGLKIDADTLDPRTRYELSRGCTLCQSHGRCGHWLATASAAQTNEHRAFCPNVELLDRALPSAPQR